MKHHESSGVTKEETLERRHFHWNLNIELRRKRLTSKFTCKRLVSNLTNNISIFYSIDISGRDSDAQLQVGVK